METIYTLNRVVHMEKKEDKDHARALRCHPLSQTLLQQILFYKVIAVERKITDNSLVEINQVYSQMFEITVEHSDEDSLESEHLQHVIFAKK